MIPLKKKRGTKAIQVVKILASTGRIIVTVPLTTAKAGISPSSSRRVIFSAITIASSTNIPNTTITPAKVILLTV